MCLTDRNSFIIATALLFISSCGCAENSPIGSSPTSGKPGELPRFSNLSLYSAESPFNKRIGLNPDIDPNSTMLVGSLSVAGSFVIQVKQFSSPVYFADGNTPRHDVNLTCGPAWELGVSTMKGVPIPDAAEPAFDADGADNPPVGCGEDSDQDNNMVTLDLSTRCEFDFWQARKTSGQWTASWGNRIGMDSNGVYVHGLSTRGSGFAFLGGVIWPDELQAGEIKHVLAFNYPFTKSGGPVPPATESDGESNRTDALPEGALLQLNPDIDLAALNLLPYEKTIAKALQEYGMLLVDNGGSTGVALYAIDPRSVEGNSYQGVLPDDDFPSLQNIPLNKFRVLKLPQQISDFQNNLSVVENGCSVIE